MSEHEALDVIQEALSIAAGWASKKPDSSNARDKIKLGLDAVRILRHAAAGRPK